MLPRAALDDSGNADVWEAWNSAARLVHRVQRERGATCVWVACRGPPAQASLPHVVSATLLVLDVRKQTNASVAAGMCRLSPSNAARLDAARTLADSADAAGDGAPSRASDLAKRLSLVFTLYTELIQDLLRAVCTEKIDPQSRLECLREQYGKQRALLTSLCHMSEECVSWCPLRVARVLPETVQRQHEIVTSVREAVRHLPPSVRGAVDAALQPPRLLADLYGWMDHNDFELQTLHRMLQSPLRDDIGPPSPASAAHNAQVLWDCLTAHIDGLLSAGATLRTRGPCRARAILSRAFGR